MMRIPDGQLYPHEATKYGWVEDGFVPPDDLAKYYRTMKRGGRQYLAYICPHCGTCFPPHLMGCENGFRAHLDHRDAEGKPVGGCWMRPKKETKEPPKLNRLGGK